MENQDVAHDFREGVDVEFLSATCFCNAASLWEFLGGGPSLSSVLSAPSTVAMPTAAAAAATTPMPVATTAATRLEIFNLGSRINECEDLMSHRGRCLGHGIGHPGHGVGHEISWRTVDGDTPAGMLVQHIAMDRKHETREAFADRRGFTSYLARPARAIGSV